MKNNNNENAKPKMDKNKFWTRVIAGILAGLMVLGIAASLIMSLV